MFGHGIIFLRAWQLKIKEKVTGDGRIFVSGEVL